jgi:phage gp36-like protein
MSDYLTIDDYLKRFGDAETTWLTQQEADGLGNKDMTQAAIDDAVADVESYLIGRYDLTAVRANIPPVLVGYVADLAREKLHIDRPSEEVIRRGDNARSALKEFANGTAAEETVAGGSPVAVARDPVFSDDNLAGYGC